MFESLCDGLFAKSCQVNKMFCRTVSSKGKSKFLVQLTTVASILVGLFQLYLSRVFNHALFRWWGAVERLDLASDLHTFKHGAENDVPSVQVRSGDCGDEELAAIGIRSCVRHGKETTTLVFELEVLILEFFTIDGLAASAITLG